MLLREREAQLARTALAVINVLLCFVPPERVTFVKFIGEFTYITFHTNDIFSVYNK